MATTALAKRPQTARPQAPRPATRIIEREVTAPARTKRRKSGGGGRGLLNTGITMQRGIVAYALGAAQRAGSLARVPTFGQFGALATVAVGAGFMSKGNDLAADVALCAGIVALNEVGREGMMGTPTVSGVGAAEEDPYKVEGDD